MDKIKTVKIKNPDGSISKETYTISIDAKNVDMEDGNNLQDTLDNIQESIPEAVSQLENDSHFLIEEDFTMIKNETVQNNSKIEDATGYGRVNKIIGHSLQEERVPSPSNPNPIQRVSGDVNIEISDYSTSIRQNFVLS